MIQVRIFRQADGRITGFDVSGHSGTACAGEDIVCAAVTSAVRLTECAVNDVLGLEAPIVELGASFAVAASHDLVKGFAVGRTIFADAARGWLGGQLTDEAAIRSAARQLKAQGMTYAILTLKDTAGQVYYASQTAVGAANAAPTQVELTSVASIFKEEGLVPVAALTAFRDPAGARADHALAIRYQGQEYLWLDNKASAGGNPWLNPYAAETVQYIGDLIAEVHAAGFDQVLLENVQFPSSTSAKQDYGTTNGVDRAGQLTADIAAWQARFGDTVTLWYGYSLAEVTGSSSQLGAPAAQLGVKNLLVKVPSSSTLDAAAREELTLSLTEAGVEHVVIRDDAASYFE